MADKNYDECSTCGAVTNRMPKHRQWHAEVTNDLQELERRIEELKRSTR